MIEKYNQDSAKTQQEDLPCFIGQGLETFLYVHLWYVINPEAVNKKWSLFDRNLILSVARKQDKTKVPMRS